MERNQSENIASSSQLIFSLRTDIPSDIMATGFSFVGPSADMGFSLPGKGKAHYMQHRYKDGAMQHKDKDEAMQQIDKDGAMQHRDKNGAMQHRDKDWA